MLVLITYDVNTETAAGKRRLRKVAKMCVNYGSGFKILSLSAFWMLLSTLYLKQNC